MSDIDMGMAWQPSATVTVPEGGSIPISAKSKNHQTEYVLLGLGRHEFDGPMLAHYVMRDRLAAVNTDLYPPQKDCGTPHTMTLENGQRFVAVTLDRDATIPFALNHEGMTWRLRNGDASTYDETFTAFYDEVTV